MRINDRTVWSDHVMDCMFERNDYSELEADYRKRAEEELLSEWYENLRITEIKIKIQEFHHCVADIYGYYEEEND